MCLGVSNLWRTQKSISHYDTYLYEHDVSVYGDRGGTVDKVLCSKPEGCWFYPSWCHWNFSLTENPSDRTMALGSTQPLTEISKSGRRVRLTTLPPSCAVVMKYGNLNFLEPSGPLQACNGTALPLSTYMVYERDYTSSLAAS